MEDSKMKFHLNLDLPTGLYMYILLDRVGRKVSICILMLTLGAISVALAFVPKSETAIILVRDTETVLITSPKMFHKNILLSGSVFDWQV